MSHRTHNIIDVMREEARTFMMEPEVKAILADYGVPSTADTLCQSPEEAVQAADKVGYPVVMKLVSPEVLHKSEMNLVKLGLGNEEQVADAFDGLVESATWAKIRMVGVQVSETAQGLEMIIGSKLDPQFGQLVMLGMGGVLVEVYRDVAYRLAPLEDRDVHEMISELKGAKMLKGYRGRECADIPSLVSAVVQVSRLVCELESIAEMDLNPIFVGPHGVKVADARAILR